MAKSKQKKPSRAKYTNNSMWVVNKAKRIFKLMKKFKKYRFPENLHNASDGPLTISKIQRLAATAGIDISLQI